jgi:hypothetical protein
LIGLPRFGKGDRQDAKDAKDAKAGRETPRQEEKTGKSFSHRCGTDQQR